ncbi:MAG: tRNA 2-thiocytidine(32) synthetase TtcA [Thermodesulfobacteria bacterium]|nr:tRNA 2-thiocytidine(32) synthetase TtcA [Thermodesulfobacteriota bacterium]
MVAVSGGADSLVMLHFLNEWLKKAPIKFSLVPVYLEMGFNKNHAWKRLRDHFTKMDTPFYMEETDFGKVAHSNANRGKSPCFLCSWWRRKRLFELTKVLGCKKIALGHNLDDLIETFFLNMCYSGELCTMLPRQEMFGGAVTIIRPLALVEKEKIERLAKQLRLPVGENLCPSAGISKRGEIRQMLKSIYKGNRKIRGNIAKAIFNPRPEYLPG